MRMTLKKEKEAQ